MSEETKTEEATAPQDGTVTTPQAEAPVRPKTSSLLADHVTC